MLRRKLLNTYNLRLIKQARRNMIDGHCHLSAEEFNKDRESLIEDAKKNGVESIIAVCEFPGDFENVMKLSDRYKGFVYPCIGVHPVQWENRSVTMNEYQEAERFIYEHKESLAGIGEIGLDFTPRYIKSPEDKEIQREVFKKQIRIAKEFDLPVNVHSRSAGRPVIELLIQEGATRVLLHAFDGKPSVALRGVEAGFYFSVPPCIMRSEQKKKLVSKIPLSNLMLETDAPALGPEKQERNIPSNILLSCQEIARIKNISIEEVKAETSKNARKLFSRIS